MKITDKELLTFCNLTNLKMEYAQLQYDETQNDVKIKRNHTIYSLLEKEVLGIDTREKAGVPKKTEIPLSDGAYNQLKEAFLKSNGNNPKLTSEFIRQNEIKNRNIHFLEENKREEFGSFYDETKDGLKKYFYDEKTDLRSKAPIVMEYFDRYNASNNQDSHEGAFLKEWEVIQGFDSYTIGKYLYNFGKNKQLEELEKAGETLKYSFKEFPSRAQIEDEKNKQLIFTIAKYTYIGLSNIQLGATPIKLLNDGSLSSVASNLVKSTGAKDGIVDFISFFIGFSSKETAPLKKEMEYVINANLEAMYDIRIKAQHTETIEEVLSLDDEVLKFIVLRKKDTNIYVVSIYNHEKLSSIGEIREGILPKYLFTILKAIGSILSNSENEITFTGIGNAGILANILNIYTANYDSKGFYIEDPSLISLIANFTPKDMGYLSSFDYNQFTFTFEQLFGIATTIFGIVLKKSALALPIWWMYSLYGTGQENLKLKDKNEKIENIHQKLLEMKIIKNPPKKTILINNDNLSEREDIVIEHGLEDHNKNLILGEIDKDKLEELFPLEITLKNNSRNIFNDFRKEYSFIALKLSVKIREHIIFNLLKESGYDIVAFNGEIVIFNKDFDFITFNTKEEIYKVFRKKKYYQIEEETIFDGDYIKTYTWKEIDYLNSKEKKGYPENKIKNRIGRTTDEEGLIKGILIEELPDIENNKALLIKELLQGRGHRFFILDNSGIITMGMMINEQLKLSAKIQSYLKNNSSKSYGAYLEKIGNHYDIKLECKYLSPKENKLLRRDNSSSQIEYLFFPFLSKEGSLTLNLREEYICNCIKSVIAERYESNKCLDWNLDSEIGYQRNKPQLSEREARKWIMESLEKVRNKTQIFPFINLVVRNLDENKLSKYSKLQEDPNGNPEMILGIVDENNKHLKDEVGFIYNPFNQITGKELTLYLRKMSEKEKSEPSEPTASPIVDGVILECSCGTSPTPLKVTSQSNLSMRGKFTATEKDCKAHENIEPFGNCTNIPFTPTCPLAIIGKWENTSKTFTIKDAPVLLDCSSMKCTIGGEIKPTNGVGYWKSK